MPEAASDYYAETVTLSNFALAGRLDILVHRYKRKVRITREVLDEILDGIIAGYTALTALEEHLNAGKFSTAKPFSGTERPVYRELLSILSPGEASCIACAKHRGGIVVTDDRAARTCCAERNIPYTGTIGILKACCRDQMLEPSDADSVLQAMIDAGYHAPVRRISDLL